MNYISKQFAGPIIQGFSNGVESFINTTSGVIISYFASLSIDSANEKHTEMIGKLIGFPRPLIQADIMNASFFKFAFSYYKDSDMGFSQSYSNIGSGGRFSEVDVNSNLTLMDLTTYKAILKIIAEAKRNSTKTSLTLIDSICKYIAIDKDYIITWTGIRQNILITFYDISVYSLYIVGYILNYLFDSEPDITVIKETT